VRRLWRPRLVLPLLLGLFLLRIISTYRVFSDTTDEQSHILAGLEVLERGKYEFEPQHPPLARVAVAALPYFVAGLRGQGRRSLWWDGPWATHDESFYWKTLALARAGNLVFAVLLLGFVYHWSRLLGGDNAAAAAGALAACCPNLIAHAGLATVDLAAAATFLMAAFYFWRWSEDPRLRHCLGAAAAFSLAMLSKFSAAAFLPPLAVLYFLMGQRKHWRARLPQAAAFCLLTGVILWAGYGFDIGPVTPSGHRHVSAFAMGSESSIPSRVTAAVEHRVLPAPKLWQGLIDVASHNQEGHFAYLLGRTSQQGWWYYFPIAVGLKTTLPLLALAALGGWLTARGSGRYLVAGAAVVLAAAMASNLNIGIRHVLPAYPFLTILGAGVFAARAGRALRVAAMALLGWHVVESAAAHPDYLAYFNQIASGREEQYLADSNLDWGQDLGRLAAFVRENRIPTIQVSYSGSADPGMLVGPPARPLVWRSPQPGWIAVSANHRIGIGVAPADSAWLRNHQPVAHVGKSIWLYFLR